MLRQVVGVILASGLDFVFNDERSLEVIDWSLVAVTLARDVRRAFG